MSPEAHRKVTDSLESPGRSPGASRGGSQVGLEGGEVALPDPCFGQGEVAALCCRSPGWVVGFRLGRVRVRRAEQSWGELSKRPLKSEVPSSGRGLYLSSSHIGFSEFACHPRNPWRPVTKAYPIQRAHISPDWPLLCVSTLGWPRLHAHA